MLVKEDINTGKTYLLVYTTSQTWGAVDETIYKSQTIARNDSFSVTTQDTVIINDSEVPQAGLEIPYQITAGVPAYLPNVDFYDYNLGFDVKVDCDYLAF